MPSKSLEALVTLAQAGDKNAFDAVLRRTKPEMLAIVRAWVPAQDVDDVLQDVRAHLWKNLHMYTTGSFKAWLAVVIRNLQ